MVAQLCIVADDILELISIARSALGVRLCFHYKQYHLHANHDKHAGFHKFVGYRQTISSCQP